MEFKQNYLAHESSGGANVGVHPANAAAKQHQVGSDHRSDCAFQLLKRCLEALSQIFIFWCHCDDKKCGTS